MEKQQDSAAPRFGALLPFFVFVVFYLGLSLWCQDFYKVPMPTAFLVAGAVAVFQNRKSKVEEKVEIFSSGMGESNIMMMCLIFILAGAFATVAKGMGAVQAAVVISQHIVPPRFMLTGLFLVACFISLAIGTSCGTIMALVPIAMGLVPSMHCPPELVLGAVIGGAMFGDNMSMISDTTIAATRTQNVAMKDKFITNFKMVMPAALIAVIIYLVSGKAAIPGAGTLPAFKMMDLLTISPYVLILVLALCGLNVMALLFCGTLLAGIIGIFNGAFDFWSALDLCGKGTLSMAETLIVAILAGGLLKLIRFNGGIRYLMEKVGNAIRSPKACELGIALLVAVINLFTANNTVAIVIAGPLAKELSDRYHCSPKRIAGILDTASCAVQGVIPYGAQVLGAVGVAKAAGVSVASLSLLGALYYPYLMAVMLILWILLHREKNA